MGRIERGGGEGGDPALSPLGWKAYTALRYQLVRHSAELKTVRQRAAVGVPPQTSPAELVKAS